MINCIDFIVNAESQLQCSQKCTGYDLKWKWNICCLLAVKVDSRMTFNFRGRPIYYFDYSKNVLFEDIQSLEYYIIYFSIYLQTGTPTGSQTGVQ